MIFLFWGVSLLNPTLPHWSGPGYIPLFFVGALYLEQRSFKVVPGFIKMAATLVVIVLMLGVALIRLSPVNVGFKQDGFIDVDYVIPVLGGAVTQW